ncbi:MAG TPA: hypothetical protein VJ654_20775 [Noviherbaspirillum sp.]|nr:hypothetical protein [Noviherbaspirillum sp.]
MKSVRSDFFSSLLMKKIIPALLCLYLGGCHAPMVKKEGLAIGFQRAKVDDHAFQIANYGQRTEDGGSPTTDKSFAPTTSAAIAGGTSAMVAGAAPIAKTVAVSGAQAISAAALAPVAVGVALGASVAYIGSALHSLVNEDTDCGDGWALFTLQTAEGEVKTIRQPRYLVCQYKSGDKVQYSENETGILVHKKE